MEYFRPFVYLLWKENQQYLKNINILETIVFDGNKIVDWFKYSNKQKAILKKHSYNIDILSCEQAFTYAKPNSTNIACIQRIYDIPSYDMERMMFNSTPKSQIQQSHKRQNSYDSAGQLKTFAQFLELTHQIDRGQPTEMGTQEQTKNLTFVLQGYIPPKSDCQYNCYFADIGNDSSQKIGLGNEQHIAFDIVVTRFHQQYRLNDTYEKIRIDKHYESIDNDRLQQTLTPALKSQLYKMVLEIIQYISEHHMRVQSCELQWIKAQENDELYLVNMKNIQFKRLQNRPLTNSLYRHLKRNLIGIKTGSKQYDFNQTNNNNIASSTDKFSTTRLKLSFSSKRSAFNDNESAHKIQNQSESSKRHQSVNRRFKSMRESQLLFQQLSRQAQENKIQINDTEYDGSGSPPNKQQVKHKSQLQHYQLQQSPIVSPKLTIRRNKDKMLSILQEQVEQQDHNEQSQMLTNICTSPKFLKTHDAREQSQTNQLQLLNTSSQSQKKRARPSTAKATQKQKLVNSINQQVFTNRLQHSQSKLTNQNDNNNNLLHHTHQVDRRCRHSIITKLSQQNLVDDQECSQTRDYLKQQQKDIKQLNTHITNIESTAKLNEINFFTQIDEMHEDWQEKYQKLISQGKKQKKVMREKYDNEIQVLEYKILTQDRLKDSHVNDNVKEDDMIEQLQRQVKLAQSELHGIESKIKNEQQMFTERLDKLKGQKESAAFQSIQIQNAISQKIIEAMQLKLDNNQLQQELQVEYQRNERLDKIKSIEKNYREEIAYHFLMSLIYPPSDDKMPVLTRGFKKQINIIRKRNTAIENEIELISHLQKDKNSLVFITSGQDQSISNATIDQVKLTQSKMKKSRSRPQTAKKQ